MFSSGNNLETWRLSFFVSALLALSVAELFFPRRRLRLPKGRRWLTNLSLIVLNSFAVRALLPISAIGAAVFAANNQFGLLSLFPAPAWFKIVVAVVLLDLAIYGQHVAFHFVPLFWRLHRVHHADQDIDVTTGLRFHTAEILLSGLFKVAIVMALGASPLSVTLFEIVLNVTAMFSHSNTKIHVGLDRVLRWGLVTPDMHRVHHSTLTEETNSNFGFNLPWWDFLFGTYRAQPKLGHDQMEIGLEAFQRPNETSELLGALMLPFRKE